MAQKAELVRPVMPLLKITITDDAGTTPVIENYGYSRMWLQCPAETLGGVTVLGALAFNGPFAEPVINDPLDSFGDSDEPVQRPDSYFGLPYIKIVADSGEHEIWISGQG